METTKEIHIPPRYSGYKGGYAKVFKCPCGIVSMYEDFRPTSPCWRCGRKRPNRTEIVAKWVETNLPDYRWWNPFTWGETTGYWEEAKNETQ